MTQGDRLPVLEVFSRPGCHLCEQMLDDLLPMTRGCATVEVRNIDTRKDWADAFGTLIPVLRMDGRELCRYTLDRAAVAAALGLDADTKATSRAPETYILRR